MSYGNFDGSYRGNRNRPRNNYRDDRNNKSKLADVQQAMRGSMLPRWYRNAFFNDCAKDVQDNTVGGVHSLEYETVRLREDKPRERTRTSDASRKQAPRRYEPADKPTKQEKKEPAKHQAEKDILDQFISDYGNHISDISYLTRLIMDTFPSVLRILRKYGDVRYADLNGSMDKVLTLMCTSQLSSLILKVLEDNGFDNWDEDWKNMAVVISIVLSNYGNRINNTGAKSCYVNDIIPSGAMWKREIGILTDDYSITKEMAMDLVMKIPVMAEDMKLWDLDQYYIGFEWCILAHAKDNAEIMDDVLQGKLFDFFFVAPNNNMGPKAISRFLASPPAFIPEADDEITLAIGDAFRKMLYTKLDSYDIEEIERTLKYVIRERKAYENEGKSIDISLYSGVEAMQFENIAKAVRNIINNDESAKQYLA